MQRILFILALGAAIWLVYVVLTPPSVSGPAAEAKKTSNLKEFIARTYEKNAEELEAQHMRGSGDYQRSAARAKEIESYRKKAQEIRNSSQ